MKKRRLSQETRRKIGSKQKGKKNSMYGRRHTPSALAKIQRATAGKRNPMYGKHHSLATRKKISLAARRRIALKRSGIKRSL